MLYVFAGSDVAKTRASYDTLVATLREKNPDASLVRLDPLSFDEEAFGALLVTRGLFAQKLLVTGNGLAGDEKTWPFVESKVEEIKSSPNIFIFIEGELPKKISSVLEKYAEKFSENSQVAQKSAEFNVFALLDALAERDRKRAWVLYQDALAQDIAAEELFWRIAWQVKALGIATATETAHEAEMKEFPYNKAKRSARNFKAGELARLSKKVTDLYHVSRRGGDMALGLEELVLNI